MYSANVYAILFVALALCTGFIGCWLISASLFPAMLSRTKATYGRRPVVATFVGLVAAGGCGVIAALVGSMPHPIFKALSFILFTAIIVASAFGQAGLVARIGEGLKSSRDEAEPWRPQLRGGIALALTFLAPGFGWLLVLPWALLSGFGVFVMTAFRREKAAAPALAPAVEPVAIHSAE